MRSRNSVCMAGIGGVLLAATGLRAADDLTAPSDDLADVLARQPVMLLSQIANPADQMRAPTSQPASQPFEGGPVNPWELPPVTVYGRAPLREEDRVGSYAQPRWTTDRRFAETRIYVRPEGALEFEYWLIPTVNRKGPSEVQQQYELEFGLPGRFQLDLYLINDRLGSSGKTFVNSSVELRYALADWNKIWGNPTLYVEYTFQDQAPDAIETKLLLGGEITSRWHWGTDLTFEHVTGGDAESTYEMTNGVSYTVIDSRFSVGAEFKLQFIDVHGHRGRFTDHTLLGPSLQYRPLQRMHIDLVPLIGLTHESPALQAYLVLGWDF